jgi:hypothetical protein
VLSVSQVSNSEPPGAGLVLFAACMLVMGGAFNAIAGAIALGKPSFYNQTAVFPFSDLHTWGWIILLLGAVEVLAGFVLLAGSQSQFARWFGILAAALNGIGMLLFIHSYPVLSVTIFVLEIVVIYVLAVHGGRRMPAPASS